MAKTLLSKVANIKSVIALLLVVTYCIMSFLAIKADDNFICMLLLIVGFYYGNNNNSHSNNE